MNRFKQTVAGAALIAASIAAAAGATKAKPNVIIILADDMSYGSVAANNPKCTVPTPGLDRLVKEGINFTDAHSSSSVCTPTRYSILTGRYAWRTGLKTGVEWSWYPPLVEPDRLTIADMLSEQGYRTAMIGKWHLGLDYTTKDGEIASKKAKFTQSHFVFCGNRKAAPTRYNVKYDTIDFTKPVQGGPMDCGFDSYFGVDLPNMPPYAFIKDRMLTAQPTTTKPKSMFGVGGPMVPGWTLEAVMPRFVDEAQKFVEAQAESDKPFFLYYTLTSPHTPIAPSKEFQGKSGLNAYADWVMETDWAVEQLLEVLDRTGQADNTIIIFSADNGATELTSHKELQKKGCDLVHQFKGMKRSVNEGGHRVPYIVRWPGVAPAGSSCDEAVSLNDFMATFAELTDYKIPTNAGEDSFSVLPLYKGESRAEVPTLIHSGFWGSFAIRDGDWKLIYKFDRKKNTFKRSLYNMKEDVKETTDLMKTQPERAAELHKHFVTLVENGRCTDGPAQANVEDPGWYLPFK